MLDFLKGRLYVCSVMMNLPFLQLLSFMDAELSELSAAQMTGLSSFALALVRVIQAQGKHALWLCFSLEKRDSPPFYVEDLEGISLASLGFFVTQDRAHLFEALVAALEEGIFSLIVVDLSESSTSFSMKDAHFLRLQALLRRRPGRVLFLSRKDKDAPALSPFLNLRLHLKPLYQWFDLESAEACLKLKIEVIKDKRHQKIPAFSLVFRFPKSLHLPAWERMGMKP